MDTSYEQNMHPEINNKVYMLSCEGKISGIKRLMKKRSIDLFSANLGIKGCCFNKEHGLEIATFLVKCIKIQEGNIMPTCMHMAARTCRSDIMQLLINNKVPHTINEKGLTPLHWAVSLGDIYTVFQLIQYGATLSSDKGGDDPFLRACRYNQVDIAKLLISFYDIDINETKGEYNPLYSSAYAGSVDMTKFLIERGAIYVDDEDEEDYYPTLIIRATRNMEINALLTAEGY